MGGLETKGGLGWAVLENIARWDVPWTRLRYTYTGDLNFHVTSTTCQGTEGSSPVL